MTIGKVVPLYPGGLSGYDVEIIETIALMLGGGISIRKMTITDRTLSSYIDEYGPPTSTSRGFAFPAYRWRVPSSRLDERTYLVVIDQGIKRAQFVSY